ncbi:MAG: 16S rRNA (cytosine(1402)-N(4))-methyltransferase RsmH [Puniceicoccales bacterium]|nr:16S rRNA (cytosine(1402)-N(4))-methyltransferase RsmH [Puniceicoccales bacterium]
MSKVLNSHQPVLLKEAMEALCANKGGKFLDCTFGGGGHTSAILDSSDENFVYAIDCDPQAKERANALQQKYAGRFAFCNINFTEADNMYLSPLDGILMDLGVSSFQLDDKARGFSFREHTKLDMRMDNSSGQTATEFLNTATKDELVEALRDFGEEENWKKITSLIIGNRGKDTLAYCDLFANLIAVNVSDRGKGRIHPATKTFQGIRIAINGELNALLKALPVLFEKLCLGGRLVVISFHSLEDRIVKQFFRRMAGQAVNRADNEPAQLKEKFAKILTTKPVVPGENEINLNPRSRSAKMRVLERIK